MNVEKKYRINVGKNGWFVNRISILRETRNRPKKDSLRKSNGEDFKEVQALPGCEPGGFRYGPKTVGTIEVTLAQ